MKKMKGFIITAGHLDIEWYQPMRSYRFWTMEALEQLKEAAKREDFVTYLLDGQVYPLEEYLEILPQEEEEMRKLVESGKLTIGPFYTQFDEWIPSAESMIRNCLTGKRKAEAYGGYMRAGYLPDNFGHPRQLPQILNNFGIDSLMFMRGMPEIPGGHFDEFLYEGIDGSRVLVSHFRESYSGGFDIFGKAEEQLGEPEGELNCEAGIDALQPRDIPYYEGYLSFEWHKELADHDNPAGTARSLVENVHKIKERFPSGVIPLIAGFDHLPPQINIGDSVRMANELQDEIEFVMGTAEQYVLEVQKNLKNPAVYNMELLGSRYQGLLLGALSTRTYLKRANFASETLVEKYAEPLETMAVLYGYKKKAELLKEAWEKLLINSAHDSIHGSSVDEVHVEMESRFAAVRQIATGVVHDSMKYLGRKINHWWGTTEKGILIYAPAGDGLRQVAEVWLPVRRKPLEVFNRAGELLPVQILPREKIAKNGLGLPRNESFPNAMYQKVLILDQFEQRGISSLAFRSAEEQKEFQTDLAAGPGFLENKFLKVEMKGALITITDKQTNETYHNLNLLEENEDAGDVWDYSPSWIPGEVVRSTEFPFTCEVMESGPVRAKLKLSGSMSVPVCLIGDERSSEKRAMPVTFEISMAADTPRVDVKLYLDNTVSDHRVRLCIPTGIKSDYVKSQGHLAVLDRKIERQPEVEEWVQPPTLQLPFREWLSVEDENKGIAVAVKGIYEYEAVKNPRTHQTDLYLTLVRGVEMMSRINMMQRKCHAAWPFKTPGAQCHGMQEIEWSYIPYTPKEKALPFLQTTKAFLYPPAVHAVRDERPKDGEGERLPEICRIAEENLQISAWKQTYENDAYIFRFFEPLGVETLAHISVDTKIRKVWLSDMDEKPVKQLEVKNGVVEVLVKAYQAVTLRLS